MTARIMEKTLSTTARRLSAHAWESLPQMALPVARSVHRLRQLQIAVVWATLALSSNGVIAAGNAERGAQVFRACAACHSTEAGQHLTGPSLAGIWQRKAGAAEGFTRYSGAMKRASVVWDEQTLDQWLKNPRDLIPGNEMGFAGIKDPLPRQDLIAYLRAVSEGKKPPSGRVMGNVKIDLRKPDPRREVRAMRYCNDTYSIVTATGQTRKIWEFNLRLKTDSSDVGPPAGRPMLVGTGMQGDRAAVVFASPKEISSFILHDCK